MDRSTAANAITGKKEECGEVERDIDRKEMNKGESEEERMRERRVRGSPIYSNCLCRTQPTQIPFSRNKPKKKSRDWACLSTSFAKATSD